MATITKYKRLEAAKRRRVLREARELAAIEHRMPPSIHHQVMFKGRHPMGMARITQPYPGVVLHQGVGETKALVVSSVTGAPGGVGLRLDTTGSVICLNLITAGSSFFNRIGRKIQMKTIRFTGFVQPVNATQYLYGDMARILLVYDRQPNGALPPITAILEDTEQNGTNTTNCLSGVNLNNKERFLVIMDKRIFLGATTDTAGVLSNVWPNSFDCGKNSIMIDEFRKLADQPTHFGADSTPAVIGDITTGALLLISTGISVGSNFAIQNWNARLRFKDYN
ncbi:capsid [uncultured virus]|uniref:Capsid n=1 Tax=uncultured virus TaxID=340016 RepID=A0A2K9LSD2_9VIRU|nr:capsid [uncultured virus]